jgi:hypothetical protein
MKNDGGSAYPRPHLGEEGMTMRQYYKAAAMQALLRSMGSVDRLLAKSRNKNAEPCDVLAGECAAIAESMVAEDEEHGA